MCTNEWRWELQGHVDRKAHISDQLNETMIRAQLCHGAERGSNPRILALWSWTSHLNPRGPTAHL